MPEALVVRAYWAKVGVGAGQYAIAAVGCAVALHQLRSWLKELRQARVNRVHEAGLRIVREQLAAVALVEGLGKAVGDARAVAERPGWEPCGGEGGSAPGGACVLEVWRGRGFAWGGGPKPERGGSFGAFAPKCAR